MKTMTLRKFVENLAVVTEAAFNKHGHVSPRWHVVDRNGNLIVLPTPPTDKNTAAALVRALLELIGATRCVFIDEAWLVRTSMEDAEKATAAANRGSLENYPGRVEIVMFSAEDASEPAFAASRVIIREPGKRPRLGPLKFHDDYNRSEGRFVGMLPRPPGSKTQ